LRLSLPPDGVAQHDGFADATRTAPTPGSPLLLDSHAALALWLHWFATDKVRFCLWWDVFVHSRNCSPTQFLLRFFWQDYDDLCGVFGVTQRTIGAYINEVGPLILDSMRTTFYAEVVPVMANGGMPSPGEISAWGRAVEQVYGPCPANTEEEKFYVWAAMDCVRLALPTPADYDLERAVNNRHYGGTFSGKNANSSLLSNLFYHVRERASFLFTGPNVNNGIIWAPNGKIIYAHMGSLGRAGDYAVLFPAIVRLQTPGNVPKGFKVAADAAFQAHFGAAIIAAPAFYGPLPQGCTAAQYMSWQKATRKFCEWGNGHLQICWKRLTLPLPLVDSKRNLMLELAVLLNNFRAHFMFHKNEIKTVFNHIIEEEIEAARVAAGGA
jgi:hypothetical protein